jgi:hypothetical protein
MSSVGYVLSICPLADIIQYLNSLLTPHIQQLQELVDQPVRNALISARLFLHVVRSSTPASHEEFFNNSPQKLIALEKS